MIILNRNSIIKLENIGNVRIIYSGLDIDKIRMIVEASAVIYTLPFLSRYSYDSADVDVDPIFYKIVSERARDVKIVSRCDIPEDSIVTILENLYDLIDFDVDEMWKLADELYSSRVVKIWRCIYRPEDALLVSEYSRADASVDIDRAMQLIKRLKISDERYEKLLNMWIRYLETRKKVRDLIHLLI